MTLKKFIGSALDCDNKLYLDFSARVITSIYQAPR